MFSHLSFLFFFLSFPLFVCPTRSLSSSFTLFASSTHTLSLSLSILSRSNAVSLCPEARYGCRKPRHCLERHRRLSGGLCCYQRYVRMFNRSCDILITRSFTHLIRSLRVDLNLHLLFSVHIASHPKSFFYPKPELLFITFFLSFFCFFSFFLLCSSFFLSFFFIISLLSSLSDLPTIDIEKIKSKLSLHDIAFVTKRDIPGPDGSAQSAAIAVYLSCTTITNNSFLVELKFKNLLNLCKVTIKSSNKTLSELCKVTVVKILMTA